MAAQPSWVMYEIGGDKGSVVGTIAMDTFIVPKENTRTIIGVEIILTLGGLNTSGLYSYARLIMQVWKYWGAIVPSVPFPSYASDSSF